MGKLASVGVQQGKGIARVVSVNDKYGKVIFALSSGQEALRVPLGRDEWWRC